MTTDLLGTYTRNLDFGFWHCQYSNMENLRNFGLILKVYLKFRFLGPYPSLEMATEKSILWCSSFIFQPQIWFKDYRTCQAEKFESFAAYTIAVSCIYLNL